MPHELGQEEALRRIKGMLADVQRQYGGQISQLQEQWTDGRGEFSFKAMGFNVSGNLDVRPSEVELVGDLPFAAMPFKGRIEETIQREAERLLA